jgi:hypothetical protein
MVSATSLIALVFSVSLAAATLDPASSNTKGKCPGTYNCSGKFSYPILL